MKLAVESSVIAYLCMFFLSIGLLLMRLIFTHNQALQLEEYAIMIIEHHNRYDADIASIIAQKAMQCKDCQYQILPMYAHGTLRYEVKVFYTVPILGWVNRHFHLYALTSAVT